MNVKKTKDAKPYKPGAVLIDKKMSMAVYLFTLVIAVILRVNQLNTNVNLITGKYNDTSLLKNAPFWVLLVGFALITAVMIFGESRDKAVKSCILLNPMRLQPNRLNKKISPKAGAAMLLMAFLLAYEVISDLIVTSGKNAALSTEANPVSAFSGIHAITWISYFFMAVLAVTFICTGVNIFKGEGINRANCFFLALFPIWKLLQIFDLITTYQVLGPYSEKVYIMLADMASGVFFLYTVRFFCGYEKKNTRYLMCITGYIASILAAVSVIPRYVIMFTVDYFDRENMLTPETSEIGIIFVPITIIAVFWSTYVYRVMPKLNITGKRRWAGVSISTAGNIEMKALSDEDQADKTNS